MIQNIVVFALLFVSAGVYGSTATESYKPKAKDAAAVRKVNQQNFRMAALAKAHAPMLHIQSGKMQSLERKPFEVKKGKTSVKATLRGSAAHVETESLSSSKTRMFSPNKGYIQYSYYEDVSCSSATSVYASAVNFCYYDEDTMGADAEVAVIKKYSDNSQGLVLNTFAFTDSSCTSLNTTSSYTEDLGYRSYCYSYEDNSGNFEYAFSMDYVSTPTAVSSSGVITIQEYKTETACNNENSASVVGYYTTTSDDFGCQEYFNDGEYFMLSCSNSVVQADVYSDSSCTVSLRSDDLTDLCASEYVTYPSRLTCDSSV